MPPGRPRRQVTLPPGAVEKAAGIRAAKDKAKALKGRTQAELREYVLLCRKDGISVRDIAYLLGITPQRVSQIARHAQDGR